MYLQVGRYPNPRALADRAHLCKPVESELGYATTDRDITLCVYREALGDVFKGEWMDCKLAIVWPYGCIHPHADILPADRERFFLVLQTNPDSWCLHDGQWQQLEEGGIYSVDPSKVHAAVNLGTELRINFVVDVRRNG